jgi:hypothetical protein
LERPAGWTRRVNAADTEAELTALRHSMRRGSPVEAPRTEQAVRRLGLEMTLRPRGGRGRLKAVPDTSLPFAVEPGANKQRPRPQQFLMEPRRLARKRLLEAA